MCSFIPQPHFIITLDEVELVHFERVQVINRLKDGWTNGWMDWWLNGLMDEWTDDEWTDGWWMNEVINGLMMHGLMD